MFKKRRAGAGWERHPDFPRIAGASYLTVLAEIEKRRKVDWYLEIGSRTGKSLVPRSCNFVAVDPQFARDGNVLNASRQMHFMQMTSDDFFATDFLKKNGIEPQLTFIDGMHLFEYALHDFINAEKSMPADGIICLHDVVPVNYAMTTRDTSYYEKLRRPWTGDVWKLLVILREYRPDLDVSVVAATKTGLGCVTRLDKRNDLLREKYDEIVGRYGGVGLEDFGALRYFGMLPLRDTSDYLATITPPV